MSVLNYQAFIDSINAGVDSARYDRKIEMDPFTAFFMSHYGLTQKDAADMSARVWSRGNGPEDRERLIRDGRVDWIKNNVPETNPSRNNMMSLGAERWPGDHDKFVKTADPINKLDDSRKLANQAFDLLSKRKY